MSKFDLTKMAKGLGRAINKQSPKILIGIGIAGMITSAFLAVKETPKALELIEVAEEKKEEPLTVKEKVETCWKCYLPAVVTGVVSVGCIIGGTSVGTRRAAALATAYKLSENALNEYKEKVAETVSEEDLKTIKRKVAEEKVEKVTSNDKAKVIVTGDGDAWFIDALSNTPFKSSVNKLDAAANDLNKQMRDTMYISLSEFYDEIGLDHTSISDRLGWRIDKSYIDIDYSDAVVKDGRAYIVMDFLVRPEYDFDRFS